MRRELPSIVLAGTAAAEVRAKRLSQTVPVPRVLSATTIIVTLPPDPFHRPAVVNNNSDLAPLDHPISLLLPLSPIDFDLAFSTKRHDPHVQRTQLPFVLMPDLLSAYVDHLYRASRFSLLASRLELFPGFGLAFSLIAGCCACVSGGGCGLAAWWSVRHPAGCIQGSRAQTDSTCTRSGAGACTLDLLIGVISALGPLTTPGVWS